MLLFRDMNEQDVSRVATLEAEASPHPWLKKNFESCLKPSYFCKVAELGNEPVGHGVVMTAADEAHLLIITVARSHQGKGLGKQILHHLIELSKEQANTLFLEVRPSNKTAFNLYLQEGFCEIGRRRNYYPASGDRKAEDAIIMALDLTYL